MPSIKFRTFFMLHLQIVRRFLVCVQCYCHPDLTEISFPFNSIVGNRVLVHSFLVYLAALDDKHFLQWRD
jgi:hypothetical protein